MKQPLFCTLILIALSSCSGFLEEKQTTGLHDTIYTSEAMLEANIYGIISGFSGTYGITGEPMEFFSQASALTHWGGTSRLGKPKWDSVLKFTQYSTNEVNNKYFQVIYKCIDYCNVLLANLPDSPIDESFKRQIEAEAKFYRGVLYFNAVRIWGDLPLRTEVITVENSTNCPRSSYSKVYAQIVDDFTDAAAGMRSPQEVRDNYNGALRPDKFAPIAYLSSVYVTIGSLLSSQDDNFWDNSKENRRPDFSSMGIITAEDAYRKALACAESLIPESELRNPECRYQLVDKYSDLFHFDPEYSSIAYDNPEQIFALLYTPQSGGGYHASRTLPQYCEGTRDCVETSHSSNTGRFRPNRWVFQKWCETYPGTKQSGRYISSSDPRLDASLFYSSIVNACNEKVTKIYPNVLENKKISVYPYFKKYWSSTYNMDTGSTVFYCMRFAEVYLNAAEAAAYLKQDQKAYDYIEVLHKRARGTESDQPRWEAKRFATTEELLIGIFWERIFELYGEGHEWNEVHRHGAQWIIDNISIPKNEFLDRAESADLRKSGSDQKSYNSGFYYSTSVEEVRKGLLAAFPNNEFLYNKGISYENQNDYYFE